MASKSQQTRDAERDEYELELYNFTVDQFKQESK